MKKITFGILAVAACTMVRAAPPNEDIVKSCLRPQSAMPSVVVNVINVDEVTQEDDYVAGFNAVYMFKYRGGDAGYAKGKFNQALIYFGKLYQISRAVPLGSNGGVRSIDFDPSLADWSFVEEGREKFFCVSFNFAGLGQSGDFQNIRGGYLLNSKLRDRLYFVVRDIRK